MPVSGRASRAPVLLIGPGCSCAGPALRAASLPVHVVADPEFDSVRRYPPGWRAMRDVPLHEADAEQVAWLHAQNLATLAGKVYEPGRRTVTAIDLAEALETWDADRDAHGLDGGGTPDKHGVAPPPGRSISRLGLALELACARDEASYACLVCGSRGGQVTLPALWRLGCTLPAVVINGGCAREEVAWTWPAGCRVVMLTGGRDMFNEYKTHTGETNDEARRRRPPPPPSSTRHAAEPSPMGGRQAYLRSLWAAVPPASRPMAAIVHVPSMGHVPPPDFLAAILPELVAFATYGTRPTGGYGVDCLVVTSVSRQWLLASGAPSPQEEPWPPCEPADAIVAVARGTTAQAADDELSTTSLPDRAGQLARCFGKLCLRRRAVLAT